MIEGPDLPRIASDLRVLLGRIGRRLRQGQVRGELTMSELSALSRLDREGPSTPGALAEEERIRPQAMGATLASLEQRGLLGRASDAGDGRRVLISVTAQGRALLVDRRSNSVQLMAAALADNFTPAEQAQLAAVLPLLDRLAARL